MGSYRQLRFLLWLVGGWAVMLVLLWWNRRYFHVALPLVGGTCDEDDIPRTTRYRECTPEEIVRALSPTTPLPGNLGGGRRQTRRVVHQAPDANGTMAAEPGDAGPIVYKSPYTLLHWTRHHGTQMNFKTITDELGIAMDTLNPDCFLPYAPTTQHAAFVITTGLIPILCAKYPVIVVSDTGPDVLPFLQCSACANNKFVMEWTTRWDLRYSGRKMYTRYMYMRLMRERYERHDGSITFIANNPWDQFYFRRGTGWSNVTVPVVRPLGVNTAPVKRDVIADPATPHTLVTSPTGPWDAYFLARLKSKGIQFKHIHKYGGPYTLKHYKAHLMLPYQSSVMKMYENLRAGVTTIIPSARLYRKIALEWGLEHTAPIVPMEEWTEYVEYYCDTFREYFFTYDSWEELRELVASPFIAGEGDDRVTRGQRLMETMAAESVASWKQVFVDLGVLGPAVESAVAAEALNPYAATPSPLPPLPERMVPESRRSKPPVAPAVEVLPADMVSPNPPLPRPIGALG
jgi:hypothetical protein